MKHTHNKKRGIIQTVAFLVSAIFDSMFDFNGKK